MSPFRWMGYQVDRMFPPGNPTREHIHGAMHEIAGDACFLMGQSESAEVEYGRAEQKFNMSEQNKKMRFICLQMRQLYP